MNIKKKIVLTMTISLLVLGTVLIKLIKKLRNYPDIYNKLLELFKRKVTKLLNLAFIF